MSPRKTKNSTNNSDGYSCSFCGRAQAEARRLIAGPSRIFICDECVRLCQQIIAEETEIIPSPSQEISRSLSPRDMFTRLNEYVVAQNQAKRVLSVAVYNHYKRTWSNSVNNEIELQKSNILLVGPTGSGKTLLAQTMARILDVPFAIADATSLTEAGYVGEDVENILLRLIQAADYDIPKAERGIIYIDEIDKITRKSSNPSITRDVSGEGVQQALLKVMEGCVANVPPQGGRKHPQQEFLQIKTDGILFFCGGAFEGLEKIVARRMVADHHRIGFRSSDSKDMSDNDVRDQVTPDDLLEYGFIPEFIGRMPIIVGLHPLDNNSMEQVLTEPKNAVIKQYEHLFALDNVELQVTPQALSATAAEAINRKTGARALRTIIEERLLDVMYELPSLPQVQRCILDADAAGKLSVPLLLTASGKVVQVEKEQSKSA